MVSNWPKMSKNLIVAKMRVVTRQAVKERKNDLGILIKSLAKVYARNPRIRRRTSHLNPEGLTKSVMDHKRRSPSWTEKPLWGSFKQREKQLTASNYIFLTFILSKLGLQFNAHCSSSNAN